MSWIVEMESPVAAARMFNAAILDWHNLGPEIAPEVLVSGTREGNVRQLNFTSAMPYTYLKERIDIVDHQNLECELTVIGGGLLGAMLESASVKYKVVEAIGGDGCLVKVTATTKPLPGVDLDVEAAGIIDKAKEATVKHFKTVEAYLQANLDKYCGGRGGGHPRGFSRIQAKAIVYGDAVQNLDGFGFDFFGNSNRYSDSSPSPSPPRDKSGPASSNVHDDVPARGGGDRHGRSSYGIQSNGIVFGDAIQSAGFGYGRANVHDRMPTMGGRPRHSYGIQSNGVVFGDAVQQFGGFGYGQANPSNYGRPPAPGDDDNDEPEGMSYFHGIQMNGKVFGKEMQKFGNDIRKKAKKDNKSEQEGAKDNNMEQEGA